MKFSPRSKSNSTVQQQQQPSPSPSPCPNVEVQTIMVMHDPEVMRQSDFATNRGGGGYPNPPSKVIARWEVSLRFNAQVGAAIEWKIKPLPVYPPAAPELSASPAAFTQYAANDVWKAFPGNPTYQGVAAKGKSMLSSPVFGESTRPPYDPAANPFPNPNVQYDFLRMNAYSRWFCVNYEITIGANGCPSASITAVQKHWVPTAADRNCPDN